LPPPDYLARLMAHLNAYKHYPRSALLRHEQGTVRLRFIMDRMGNVKSYEVVGSSGFPDLDDEARSVIQNAQPLPPVPPNYPGTNLDLVLPLVFSLR
jgi:protein TonB